MGGRTFGVALLGAMLTLSGCAWFSGELDRPERFHAEQLEGEFTPVERTLLDRRQPQLGIALSGGGLRSALYAAGALKALYDNGLLPRTEVLSTVSGGGYTGYWVYTSQRHADAVEAAKQPFGAAVFGPEAFPESLCQLVTNANFVTLGQMVRNPTRHRAVKLYDRRIGEVFGLKDDGTTMAQTGEAAKDQRRPYVIVNATVDRKRAVDWVDGLYEFNGVGTRGAGRGEISWGGFDGGSFTYRQAVGISGAAFAPFLKQTIAEPPGAADGRTRTLDDGGAAENLGAIALIRRAVPNIVIIDAEHDPRYRFGAYVNLKRRLPHWGADISIPGIEAWLASGRHSSPDESYFSGTAIGRRADGSVFTSRIHYLKMSLGPRQQGALAAAWRGRDLGPESWRQFEAARRASYDAPAGCAGARGLALDLPQLFGFAVHHYGAWWNGRPRSHLIGGFLSLDFPQYSTGDQSMYVDQAPAFIGLGYLQASAAPLSRAEVLK